MGTHYSRKRGGSRGALDGSSTLRADALACHAAALAAIEPGRLLRTRLGRDHGELTLHDGDGHVVARHRGPVLLVGAGKGALAMGRAAAAASTCRKGLLIVPRGLTGEPPLGCEVEHGSHPVPDAGGLAATARLVTAVRSADRDTLVLLVLSGGASALLVAPAASLTLEDKRATTAALLAAGAEIGAINAVRKHCSIVKGGGLARAAAGAAGLWTLLLSDVVGDDPSVIASGPSVADPTTFGDARSVLQRHLRPADVPRAVSEHLARGAAGLVPETVKAGEAVLARARTVVVGGNAEAVQAAATEARQRGYAVTVVPESLTGDAGSAGRSLARRLLALDLGGPVALIAGGETTVRARGGLGGRCQHLALAAAEVLAGRPAVLLAVGTDGIDGPTDAAGACVDGGTASRAAARGIDRATALATTDSHPVLVATGDVVRTGPSGTNVADLVIALSAPDARSSSVDPT